MTYMTKHLTGTRSGYLILMLAASALRCSTTTTNTVRTFDSKDIDHQKIPGTFRQNSAQQQNETWI